MAKTDTATLLESSRNALRVLEEEIAGYEATRNERLLANDPATKISALDRELGNSRAAAGIERDRIKLFEAQLAREKEELRLKDKLGRIEQVEALFRERDAAGLEVIQAIAMLDSGYRKLFTVAREIRDAWPFRMVDCAPALVSESEIEAKVAQELWRIGGRPVVTGGALPNPDGGSLPHVKPPTIAALGNPSAVEPLEAALQQATRFASDVMREGKSSGPIESATPPAAVGPSGRTHGQLTAEMARLGAMEQTEDVERKYSEVVAELAAMPLPEYLQQTKPKRVEEAA
jgi:hypothetical protein